MTIADITNATADIHYDHAAIQWEHGGFRFHFWVDLAGLTIQGRTVYKNPPLPIKFGDPGYFKTRHLDTAAAAHRLTIQEMQADSMAAAKLLADRKRLHAEGYALAMLDVLRECRAHVGRNQALLKRVDTIIAAATLPVRQ